MNDDATVTYLDHIYARNNGRKYPPPHRDNAGLPALVIIGAAFVVAGIVLALIF